MGDPYAGIKLGDPHEIKNFFNYEQSGSFTVCITASSWELFGAYHGVIGLVDSAGEFGLTWEGLLFFGTVYTVALFWGLWLAIGKRGDRFAIIQLIPVLGLLLWSLKPTTRFDPAKFQEWVGRPQEELIERLGKASGKAIGHDDVGEYVRVPGMIAYFSKTDTVIRVLRNDDR